MRYVRVESVEATRIFAIFEVTLEEYAEIIRRRNQAQERERIEQENEIDRERERQWYRENE
jgi:hypothetical protein